MIKKEAVGVPTVEINPEFRKALDLMEDSHRHIFITGRAGTGKSMLLTYFRRHTGKTVVVLAPTGVAAINVGGQTIHSFFGFRPDVTPAAVKRRSGDEQKNIYRKVKTIVIDEVSMVRVDLLDCMDKFLRLNVPDGTLPFGGIQMIFIGDLYQLPPVVGSHTRDIFRTHYATPYFFSAQVFAGLDIAFVELEKIYRQQDDGFIRLLNAIRNRTVTDGDIALFNQRHDPDFAAPPGDFYIHLTSTNDLANAVNEEQLARLPGRVRKFTGLITGEFGKEYLPTAPELKLRKNAQIMLLNNDSYGRWINGTIGRVTGFKKDEEGETLIQARLDNGEKVDIAPNTWEIYRFFLKDGELASETVGAFTQYPVRLAFAVTIHKSQGKTFAKAVIDVGRGTFAHGQMYVALSRCTSLEGIVLKQPLRKSHILLYWQVVKFLTQFQYAQADRQLPKEDKVRRLGEAIRDKKQLEIVYLKAKDEKSRRTIRPLLMGEMEYKGHPFTGLTAFCLTRREKRVFNVDRILEIHAASA
ncbi:MAG: ATP-dependent helicase [Thermodesulfobacteriota bacterium]|nr:ATP-dependent helicase [Thermodesulfobacteriota bacterium]